MLHEVLLSFSFQISLKRKCLSEVFHKEPGKHHDPSPIFLEDRTSNWLPKKLASYLPTVTLRTLVWLASSSATNSFCVKLPFDTKISPIWKALVTSANLQYVPICICQNQLVNLVYSSTFKWESRFSGHCWLSPFLASPRFSYCFYLNQHLENGFTSPSVGKYSPLALHPAW